MGNLYRLNSLFEIEIYQYPNKIVLDKSLLERSTAFEYLFLLVSQPEDFTILSEIPSKELLQYWNKNEILHGKVIVTDEPYYSEKLNISHKFPADMNLIEWGKTSTLYPMEGRLEKKKNPIFLSNYLNSKVNQTHWKDSIKSNKLTTVICLDKIEVQYCFNTLNFPIVIKSEFGFSGRGSFVIETKIEADSFLSKIDEFFRVNSNGLIIEEWVGARRIEDFSGIFQISARIATLQAVTKMLVDKNGTYRGSIIKKKYGKELEKNIISIVSRFARYGSSYNGPLTIDGFIYQEEMNQKVQYMSEINVRYSMGRVLFELHKKLGKENEECGLFFAAVKNKGITFDSVLAGLSKIENQFGTKVLIITPLINSSVKTNPFLGFYLRDEKEIRLEIFDSIKALLG